MKKLLSALALSLIFTVNVFGSELSVRHAALPQKGAMEEDGGHTYTFTYKNGNYGIVSVSDAVYAYVYDTKNNPVLTKKINIVEKKFGGYYFDGSCHYILMGTDNESCSSSRTVYKLLKFNSSFNKMSTTTVKGGQIFAKDIFLNGGTANIKVDGNYLFINDVVTEYKYENNFYKNNRSYVYDATSMKYITSVGGIALSRNEGVRSEVKQNFSAADDEKFYFAVNSNDGIGLFYIDPTDNESLGNHSVAPLVDTNLSAYEPATYLRKSAKNEDVDLFGLEVGEGCVVSVERVRTVIDNGTADKLLISYIDKGQIGDIVPSTINLAEDSGIENVKIKKLADNDIVVMWEDSKEVVNYCHLDGGGQPVGEVKKIHSAELTGDMPYFDQDGVISWAEMVNDIDYTLYKYNPNYVVQQ